MKVKNYKGETFDYVNFGLEMSYDLIGDKLKLFYFVTGSRFGEYGLLIEDVLKTFDSPEKAAVFHNAIMRVFADEENADEDALQEIIEDIYNIPFAPIPEDGEC